MSDPKTVITRIFEEVVNQRREAAIDELFTEDFVDHGPTGDLAGREAFRASVQQWLGAFSDLHCEVSQIVVEGDMAAWVVHTTGVHTGDTLGFPATGRRIDTLSPNLGRVRDGKAVEHWSEQGMLAMLVQLGILPEMAPPAQVS
jgi:predicted ester cyclase